MTVFIILAVIVATNVVVSKANGQTGAATGDQNSPQEPAVRPEFVDPEIDPSLPNVLLIGDSISIAYTLPVRDRLVGEANVFRPAINCGPTSRGLRRIDQWIGARNYDVIHFNFGLHDLKYIGPDGDGLVAPDSEGALQQVPVDQYAANLRGLVETMSGTGAILIWRDTTPVPIGSRGRVTGDAAKYNAVAARVLRDFPDVRRNEIHHKLATGRSDLQRPANVHYTPAGSRWIADQVAQSIREALQARTADQSR